MNETNENYTLGQLIFEVGCLIKKYEGTQKHEGISGTLLKTKEVLELYPMMTQYGLEQAVKEDLIPVIKRGKLNFYDSNDIEKYIKSQKKFSSSKKDNCNSKIKYI